MSGHQRDRSLGSTDEELKNELKRLIRFQVNNNVDSEVYSEEYKSISKESNQRMVEAQV